MNIGNELKVKTVVPLERPVNAEEPEASPPPVKKPVKRLVRRVKETV
jgi:hypothetical protein